MVKHDQKYTESYYTKKSHYSKTQTIYPNARLHIKIIYNIFPFKHPDLHVRNKCALCWFTLHNHNTWYKNIQLTNSSSNILKGIQINSLNALQSNWQPSQKTCSHPLNVTRCTATVKLRYIRNMECFYKNETKNSEQKKTCGNLIWLREKCSTSSNTHPRIQHMQQFAVCVRPSGEAK
jgi:hypothetical protein